MRGQKRKLNYKKVEGKASKSNIPLDMKQKLQVI